MMELDRADQLINENRAMLLQARDRNLKLWLASFTSRHGRLLELRERIAAELRRAETAVTT